MARWILFVVALCALATMAGARALHARTLCPRDVGSCVRVRPCAMKRITPGRRR